MHNFIDEHILNLNLLKKIALSSIAGSIFSLAFAPFYQFVAIFFAVPIYFLLVYKEQSRKHLGLIAFFYGLAHFITSLYWISIALTTDGDRFLWLIPFAIIGLNSLFALYFVLGAYLFYYLQTKNNVLDIFLFSAIWVCMELLRGYLFTGFPWNLTGYTINFSESISQIASIIGVYGLSFITILLASSICTIFLLKNSRKQMLLPIMMSVIFVSIIIWGHDRLKNNETQFTENKVMIVQPSIPQDIKWRNDKKFENLLKHITLTEFTLKHSIHNYIDIIIWPEASIPYYVNEEVAEQVYSFADNFLKPGQFLVTGGIRAVLSDAGLAKVYNSMFFTGFSEGKHYFQYYDKNHLVPFGEYMPFRSILPIEKITHGAMDFYHGTGYISMKLPGIASFSPIICYEAIFPWEIVGETRPEWLLNITNDAWYGESSGPYQHFAAARFRSIELGLPLVRAANNGISAVIDSYGRVIEKLDLNNVGTITSPLPTSIKATFYSKFYDFPLFTVLLIIFIYAIKVRLNKT